jgi:membrane-associated phospholipid phosphatase
MISVLLSISPAHADPPTPSLDPVRSWNELALATVRAKGLSDAQAARLYALVNVAMYDAVNGIVSKRRAHDRRQHALVPTTGAPPQGNLYAAASAAAHAVLSGEFPDQKVSVYDPQLQTDLAALGTPGPTNAGKEWGAQVGADVRLARANDGSSPNETQAAGAGPGQFRASWSGVQFRNLVPFGITDPSEYVGSGTPALTSLDYAAAFAEVKLLGNAAIPDAGKLATFQYWSLGGGTWQPPGAWIQVALVSMSLADTVAPTFTTKFVFRHWRPATAIREAGTDNNPLTDSDPNWLPRAVGIGTSPEYWSGHSSFSGAGAAALAGFFCNDNISFTLKTDPAIGVQSRTYPGFSVAADEAGLSRVVGGIHFNFSNLEGLASGRGVAAEILANKLLLERGPTHFDECPL